MIKISNHTDVELAEPSQSWLNSLERKYDKTKKVKKMITMFYSTLD